MNENCNCKAEGINNILSKYTKDKDNLIQILNEVQETYGYVPVEVQEKISEVLDIPLAEVYGVITFYSRFSEEPKGKYNISVCLGTACYVKEANNILDKIKEVLKINEGETTKDGKFSLEATRCIGACSNAPVFVVNGDVYGKATVDKVEEILSKYE